MSLKSNNHRGITFHIFFERKCIYIISYEGVDSHELPAAIGSHICKKYETFRRRFYHCETSAVTFLPGISVGRCEHISRTFRVQYF